MNISQAEKGYNKDTPSSRHVKDIKTLYHSLNELDLDLSGKILVLDLGFFSDDVVEFLDDKNISYILPTKRNSRFYNTRIHLSGDFYYHDRLIRCGKRECGNFFLYLFEDQDLMREERKTLYRKLDEHKINKKKFDAGMKKAGKILILSDMDVEKREIYLLYKKREVVEKMFDTYKTVLNADKLYLQDDESVFGHVFIAFLSLSIHCKLEQLLKKAKLDHKFTPIDLLFNYGKVYHVDLRDRNMITEVPKKVRDLEERLGLNIFPK